MSNWRIAPTATGRSAERLTHAPTAMLANDFHQSAQQMVIVVSTACHCSSVNLRNSSTAGDFAGGASTSAISLVFRPVATIFAAPGPVVDKSIRMRARSRSAIRSIVTGGTRGIGEAIVRGIVAEGGRVVFGGRDEAAGSAISRELGNQAYFVRQDVALEDDWRKIVAVALQAFGRINGLVNNAGSMGQHGVSEITMDLAQSLFATNQLAVLLGIKHVVGPMRSIGSGSIVNIGSVAVRRGMAGISAYMRHSDTARRASSGGSGLS